MNVQTPAMQLADIILTEMELVQVTGYRQPAAQLTELQRQGFSRARRSRGTGEVILERAHYEAVCAGHRPMPRPKVRAPKVQQPKLRVVAMA